MPVTWSDEKLILLYCPVGVRTHDLRHTVASNMGKVSYALTHSDTAAVMVCASTSFSIRTSDMNLNIDGCV